MAKEIDVTSKRIAVGQIRRLIIKGDAGIDTVKFKLLKSYNDNDLSTATWIVKYKLPVSGSLGFDACTLETDGSDLYVIWTPSDAFASEKGSVEIQLQATIDASTIWHSEQAKVDVLEGLASGSYTISTASLDTYLALFQDAQSAAEAAQTGAETAATTATTKAGEASDSATAAALSETNAASSESAAATHASTASTHKTDAETAKTAAETAQAAAESAKSDSESARDKAESWAEEAEDTEVETGKYSAKHHALKAAASKVAAESAQSAAETAATTATTKANEAATSETNAQSSANSASADSTAAESAKDTAVSAKDTAVSAASVAIDASTSAQTAQSAAEAASTKASQWAEADEDVEVETGLYSAQHHALKALASKTAAETAQGAAETAQAAAEAAAADAAQIYDNFDDRYLGSKASDPSTDNDGEALTEGLIYWNSTDKKLKIYNGTSWVLSTANASDVNIADAGDRYTVTDVESALQEIAGPGRSTETVKGNADDITDIKGTGWTDETIKGNADAINSLGARVTDNEGDIDALELKRDAFENLFTSLTNPLDIKPVLNLDFANRKVLDPRITFNRASTGRYYDGKTFAKAEENLLKNSERFTTYWSAGDTTVVENDAIAPDGTLSADKITHTSGSAFLLQGSDAKGPLVTKSIYAKYIDAQYLRLRGGVTSDDHVWFDIQNGVVGTVGNGITASIEDVGNGWYRCVSLSAYPMLYIGLHETDGSTIEYEGSAHIWGAQVEDRDSLTAYTKTTGQPITNYIPVLQEAPVDTPRFDHDPVTLESLGLLIEEQRTNESKYSEAFDNAVWVKKSDGVEIVPNTVISPDGELTADIFKPLGNATATGEYYCRKIRSDAGTFTFSVYAKKRGYRYITLKCFGIATFDFDTESFTNQETESASFEAVGNGWYRLSVTDTTPDSTWYYGLNIPEDGAGDVSWGTVPNASLETAIWGAQLEEGSFPTSYIPTSGSQVTRSADIARMTGENFSSWYRQDEGSIYLEASSQLVPLYLSDGTVQNRVFFNGANDSYQIFIETNDVTQANLDAGETVAGELYKYAVGLKKNASILAIDGTLSAEDASCLMPLVDRIVISGLYDNSSAYTSHIKKLAYYNKRLPDADLQTLTS